MCRKQSFVMNRSGKVYDLGGFEQSHTRICLAHGLDQDKCNAYEWQPPEGWPDAEWLNGLIKDLLNFTEKSSHLDALENYIKRSFPTTDAWENYQNYDVHGLEYQDGDFRVIIACKPEQLFVEANKLEQVEAYGYGNSQVKVIGNDNSQVKVIGYNNSQVDVFGNGNSQVDVFGNNNSQVKVIGNDNSQVKVFGYDNSQVEVYGSDNSQVEAYGYGNSQVKVYGYSNSQIKAYGYDHSQVKIYGTGKVEVYGNDNSTIQQHSTLSIPPKLTGLAVLIDRSVVGIVKVRKARVKI